MTTHALTESDTGDKFWGDDFSILFSPDNWSTFIVSSNQTWEEKLNASTRTVFLVAVTLFVCTGNVNVFWILVLFLLFSYTVYYYRSPTTGENSSPTTKQFRLGENSLSAEQSSCVAPTYENPLMNPLLTDAPSSPLKPLRTVCSVNRKDIDDKLMFNLYRDSTDVFETNNSVRQFYTVPDPSAAGGDQSAYMAFLYPLTPTLKERHMSIVP